MHDLTLWLTPLALIPAVALLTYSTATRCGRLREHGAELDILSRRRIALLRTALIGLYASLVLLAAALLVGLLTYYTGQHYALVVLLLTSSSIFALIVATLQLTREALLDRRAVRGEQA